MKSVVLTLAILAISAISKSSDTTKPDLVIELFRHGARSPKTLKYDTKNKWEDLEELTSVGMRMQYILGAAIKEDYEDNLIPYNPAEIYVRSVNLNRTLMSAYS